MDAPATSRPATGGSHDSDHLLLHVGRTLWDNLPASCAASVLMLIAAAPGLFLVTGISWLVGWPLLLLCTGSVWAGITAASGRLLDGDAVTLPAMLGLVRQHAWTGIRISVIPAIVGLILLGSLEMLDRNPHAGWIVIPLLLDLGVAIVVFTSLVTIFTLATSTPAPTSADLWLASAAVTISRPIPVLGTLALVGLVLSLAAMIGPVALIALGPLAMLCVAVTRDARLESPAGADHH